ncbi:hypothetical protein BJ742DRAFT_735498 [Cladochytrium replicatum]|nr:hypothetical protein BJ742DRAFT_735498 [Cladochytrium replicatum]
MAVPRHARTAFFSDNLYQKKQINAANPPSPTLTQSTNARMLDIVNNYTDDSNDSTVVPPNTPYNDTRTEYPESLWSEDQRSTYNPRTLPPRELDAKLKKALALRHNPSLASMDQIDEEFEGHDNDQEETIDTRRAQMRNIAHEYMLRSPPNGIRVKDEVSRDEIRADLEKRSMERPLPVPTPSEMRTMDRSPQPNPLIVPQPIMTTRPIDHQQQPQRAVWFASHLSPPDAPPLPTRPNAQPQQYPPVQTQQYPTLQYPTSFRAGTPQGMPQGYEPYAPPQQQQYGSRSNTPQPNSRSATPQQYSSPPQSRSTTPFQDPQPPVQRPPKANLRRWLSRNPAQLESAPRDRDDRNNNGSSLPATLWSATKTVAGTAVKVRKALSPFAIAARFAMVFLVVNVLIVDVLLVVFAVKVLPVIGKAENLIKNLTGGKL